MNEIERVDDLTPDERNWAVFAHLAAFAGLLFPFGNVLGPLVVWLIKKDQYPFVEDQAKEAMNFQITVTLIAILGWLLSFVLIGVLILIPLAIYAFVMTIIAAVRANRGERYRYPYTLRLIG